MLLRQVKRLAPGMMIRVNLAGYLYAAWGVEAVTPGPTVESRWTVRLWPEDAGEGASSVGAMLFPDDMVEMEHA